MNKDNAHLYAPLIAALADGELEYRESTDDPWCPGIEIEFSASPNHYRRRPKKRKVPLERGDLPFPCALRHINGTRIHLVTQIDSDGYLCFGNSTMMCLDRLFKEGWLYSATPNDTASWRRCEKEVEE
jgi:hypothetical protein